MIGPSHPAFKNETMVIGLSGYARTGKDTVAAILKEEFAFEQRSFADTLRDFLYALNPKVEGPVRVSDVIDEYGWGGYKETSYGEEMRELLQRLGTDAGRNIMGENIWVDSLFTDAPDKLVIADCRFANEAEGVRERGGKMVRIRRAGIGPANDHISEVSLDAYDFDYVIDNDGDFGDLRQKVRDMMRHA